jgi:hypothetical protein
MIHIQGILYTDYVFTIFRVDAMIRIQDALRDNNPGEGLALLRAARYNAQL